MKRYGIGFVLGVILMALAAPATAQVKNLEMRLHNAAVATGNGTTVPVEYYGAVAFHVTISATATVTFEGSVDGSAFVSLVCISIADTARTKVTTATATGAFQCNTAGLQSARARISSYTSGTVTVNARATTAVFTTN